MDVLEVLWPPFQWPVVPDDSARSCDIINKPRKTNGTSAYLFNSIQLPQWRNEGFLQHKVIVNKAHNLLVRECPSIAATPPYGKPT
jgi:hypothetical protein